MARGGDYHLLTGGLGRLADSVGNHASSNSAATPAKDVWVLAGEDAAGSAAADVAWPQRRTEAGAATAVLQPRVAENLFRLGSHAEQAEGRVRLLRVVDDLAEDWTARPGTSGASALAVMRQTLEQLTGTEPGLALVDLVAAADRPGTLANAVRLTVDAAQALREQLSLDTWIVLGSLDRVLADARNDHGSRVRVLDRMDPLGITEGWLGRTGYEPDGAMLVSERMLHFSVHRVWPLLDLQIAPRRPESERGLSRGVRAEVEALLSAPHFEVLSRSAEDLQVLAETAEAARLGALAVEVEYEVLPAVVTVEEAIDNAVPMPVIAASLFARFASRQPVSPALQAVAALRGQFGGHAVMTTAEGEALRHG